MLRYRFAFIFWILLLKLISNEILLFIFKSIWVIVEIYRMATLCFRIKLWNWEVKMTITKKFWLCYIDKLSKNNYLLVIRSYRCFLATKQCLLFIWFYLYPEQHKGKDLFEIFTYLCHYGIWELRSIFILYYFQKLCFLNAE